MLAFSLLSLGFIVRSVIAIPSERSMVKGGAVGRFDTLSSGIYYEQLSKRDVVAPGAVEQIGTSNAAVNPSDINSVPVEEPSRGAAGGVLNVFGRRSIKERRRAAPARVGERYTKRQATAPKVVMGNSNPPIATSQMNMMPEENPAKGDSGPITPFSRRGGAAVTEPTDTDAGLDVNLIPHMLAATRGFKGGAIEEF